MRPLRILPRADQDVDEAADYYADEGGLDLGLRFLQAVEETFLESNDNPQSAGALRHASRQFRPLDREGCAHVMLASRLRERGETLQQRAFGFEGEAGSAADRDI